MKRNSADLAMRTSTYIYNDICLGKTHATRTWITRLIERDALMSCKNTNASSVTILLSCSSNQWIHVRSETYGNTTLEQGCLDTTNSSTNTRMTDDDGLIVNCNGKQTCPEHIQASTPVRSYKIIYDCVEERLDVCSSENKSTNEAVYLHSPGFPNSDGVTDNCTCRITGRLMLIQLIEHRGNKKDLNISTDGDNLEQGVTPVNRIIVQRANHTTLNYQGMEDGRFWIKVTGPGMIYVKCSNESNNMLATSMSTTAPDTTKDSSSRGMVNVTFANEVSTISSDTTSSDTTSSDTTSSDTISSDTTSLDTTSSDTTSIGNTAESSDTASSTVPASTIIQFVTSTEFNYDTGIPRTDALNSTAIVGGVCGVIILILIIAILLLVYCKVLKPSRGEANNFVQVNGEFGNLDTNTSDSPYEPVTSSTLDTSAPDSDEQRSRDANNTYSGLSQYENQDGHHEYSKIHVYGNTRV